MNPNYYITATNADSLIVYWAGFGWTTRGRAYAKTYTERHANYHLQELTAKQKQGYSNIEVTEV